ncbi:Xin actin-binding repeat-containing protein 2 [Striga asiatica]|uniref:Xin actin-binding repeat-containing protein 2 n=1 Tax=Striga asiatica TaxID=4170 RepID=A0A5A7Q2C4_STRAF|nr:Xin actin-binding repeat-containing protein 2 [Striga asiatica]
MCRRQSRTTNDRPPTSRSPAQSPPAAPLHSGEPRISNVAARQSSFASSPRRDRPRRDQPPLPRTEAGRPTTVSRCNSEHHHPPPCRLDSRRRRSRATIAATSGELHLPRAGPVPTSASLQPPATFAIKMSPPSSSIAKQRALSSPVSTPSRLFVYLT